MEFQDNSVYDQSVVLVPDETLSPSQRKEVLMSFYKRMVGTFFSSVVPGSESGKSYNKYMYIPGIYICKYVFFYEALE